MLMVSSISYFDFLHKYSKAPETVSYLRNLHRHLLNVEVTVEVFHEDREIEFYMMKDRVDTALKNHKFDDNASCETVATFLMEKLTEWYGSNRKRIVKIQEDNNGFATLIKEANE